MIELNMVIVQCQRCGAQFHSWSLEDSLEKFKRHRCLFDISEKKLSKILDNILKENA